MIKVEFINGKKNKINYKTYTNTNSNIFSDGGRQESVRLRADIHGSKGTAASRGSADGKDDGAYDALAMIQIISRMIFFKVGLAFRGEDGTSGWEELEKTPYR